MTTPMMIPMASTASGLLTKSSNLLFWTGCGLAYWSHGGTLGGRSGSWFGSSIIIVAALAFIFHYEIIHITILLFVLEFRITVLDGGRHLGLVVVVLVVGVIVLNLLNGLVPHGGLGHAARTRARGRSLTGRGIWGLGSRSRLLRRLGSHGLVQQELYRLSTLV